MKPKGLLIAVVLLAVLGAAVWWSNRKEAAAAKNPTDKTAKVLTLPEDQMADIKIKHAGGDTVALHRGDNNKWQLTEPKPLPADSDAASSLTSALASVTADKTIEDNATDLDAYGLTNPQIDVVITKKDGKTDELQLGDDTPTNSGTYIRHVGDPHIYTVGSFVKTAVNKTENDLRDKRLLTFDQDKLTRVDLAAKGPAIEFGKNAQNEWTILKPRTLRADGAQVDSLIGKLKDAKMDVANPDPDAAKKFAGATKIATATATDPAGTQTLEVRQDKDHTYFAKSSAVEGVYKITGDVGDALNKSLDDFRNKKVFDFGFSDPSKIELKNGVTYTKTGDKWMSGSRTMDNSGVQNLIDKLRDLSATKFVEKGGGQPVFEATVTSNGGKRTEKVTINKSLDQYFAQRDGEPSIYELDGKAVEDLQKAASDVKEQAPAPKK